MPTFKNIRIPIGPKVKGKARKTRMQRVQVLKSGKLKFVKNQPRGGGGKKSPVKKKPATRRSPARGGNPTASNKKNPKIGAAIQAFKGAQSLLSPVISVGAAHGISPQAATSLRTKANAGYVGNVAATAVNQLVDRKIAHGGALSRGSLTAWLPEAFAALRVADEVKGQNAQSAVIQANRKLSRTLNAYDPISGTIDLSDPDFRFYQGLKVGGGVARRLSNMGPFKRVMAPVKKLLGEMGGAL